MHESHYKFHRNAKDETLTLKRKSNFVMSLMVGGFLFLKLSHAYVFLLLIFQLKKKKNLFWNQLWTVMQEFFLWSNRKLQRDYYIRTMNGFSHFLEHSLKCKRLILTTYSWSWNRLQFFLFIQGFYSIIIHIIVILFFILLHRCKNSSSSMPLIAHWGTEALDIKRQSKMFIEKLKQNFRLWNQITIRLLFCRRERWYELQSDCWVD